MDRILIADDEPEIRSLLRLYLENEGYEVAEADNGTDALRMLAGGEISLCLLDIMMPGMDGFHVLKKLRETSDIPVIIISAKDADPEKILGLDLGADDYMVKPFSPPEAVARVRTNLRRFAKMRAMSGGAGEEKQVLVHRDLQLDLDACILLRGDEKIDLTPVEFRMMQLFMRHPGKVFTKQQIYESAWGEEYIASDNTIMVCISKLRAKLDEDPSRYIRTIRGLGYRMEKE